LEGANPQSRPSVGHRMSIIYLVVLAVFSIFAVRLFYLQVIRSDFYQRLAVSNRIRRERIIAPRGLIRDSAGRKVVIDIPLYQISIESARVAPDDPKLRLACRWFEVDEARFTERLKAWKKKYPDGREISFIADADKEQISILMENRELFPFCKLAIKHRRKYPYGSLAAHVLGYIGEVTDEEVSGSRNIFPGDAKGRMGIEYQYDRYLRGKDGVKIVEISAGGTPVGEFDGMFEGGEPWSGIQPRLPVPGNEIHLSLDFNLQKEAEGLLDGRKGSIVLMNPQNGEILAAASYPTFDPNIFSVEISSENWDMLNRDPDKPMFNRSIQATYPPGSIHKLVIAYSALENSISALEREFQPCFGGYQFGNRFFRCWKEEGHGRVNLREAIVQSCDTYFYQIGEILSADDFARAGRLFGLGRKTGIDLPGEARGIIPDHDYFDSRFGRGRWTRGHLLNYSIGQGEVLVTPIQLCLMTSVIANGGRMITPHVVRKILDEENRVVFSGSRDASPVSGLRKDYLHFLRRAMEGVIADQNGTGRYSRVPGVKTAGKTGTSQNPHGEDHALFVAYAPAQSPALSIVVILENAGHGGVEAGPLARDIMNFYFNSMLAGGAGGIFSTNGFKSVKETDDAGHPPNNG